MTRPAFSPALFLLGGGVGAAKGPPLFPSPQGEPTNGLHPRFVVAEIWADWVCGGGGGGKTGCNRLKKGPFHLFRHPKWSRIIFGKTHF